MNNRIDITDEALRIYYLESAKEASDPIAEREISHILLLQPSETLSLDHEKSLMERLRGVLVNMSLGQLIQDKMQQAAISEESLAETSNLPVDMVKEITEDKIYANNIPVVILKDLLKVLKISFEKAERAIHKTYDILQQQNLEKSNFSAFNPSFRKSVYISKDMISDIAPKTDGKELFENKLAMEKYLNRLRQLLSE
ncbi:hypothetical protein [Mucilaginibacter agri]|uniref:Uncharacterized protein n=1 Tax=Mucilaginibacter agri TaxID=2695265 RepID=A0A965ZE68_9SPHI|nr:hypothetical protein [Mucilaginibacter agri]NCD68046.1 hypothetical protein [Mucilaginibacter agri]